MSHSSDADALMEDVRPHADPDIPRQLGSNQSGSLREFEPSTNLSARIKKLEPRRIDPSMITFSEPARQFRGGHAIVSLAFMNRPGTYGWGKIEVAVKNPIIADDTDFNQALGLAIREAEFLAELSHPNIINLEGFVEDVNGRRIWLVFPWADNGNLREFSALLDWEVPERVSLINDVAQGLAYLHSREPPICHGDLKSLNVLVDQYCHAGITDFGSARHLPHGYDPNEQTERVESQPRSALQLNAAFCASSNTITLTGNKYTLRWAAPELLNADQLSLWSDIWALGWIAYEVMTNSLPFQDAPSDVVVIQRVLSGKLPSLTDNAHLSLIDELCSLMNMCWKSNPTERPTADSCQSSIKQMPMFVPELEDFLEPGASDHRSFSADRLKTLGEMYRARGEYERAVHCFMAALEASTTHDDAEELISSLRGLVQLYRLQKKYGEAVMLYPGIREYYGGTEGDKVKDLSDDLCNLAELYRLRNEENKTIKVHSKGWNVQEEEHTAKALCTLAQLHRLQYQYNVALRLYSNALVIHTDLGDKKSRAKALLDLADVHRCQHQYNEAIPLYSEALEIRTNLGDRKGKADVLLGLAEVHQLQNRYKEAIRLYTEVMEISADLGDGKGRANALCGLAQVHRLHNQDSEAIALYSKVLEIRTDLSDREDSVENLADWLEDEGRWRSTLYSVALEIWRGRHTNELEIPWRDIQVQSQYNEAISLYSQALKVRTDLGDGKGRADLLLGLAGIRRLQNQYNEAIRLYYEAVEIRVDLGDRRGKADALRGLAHVHRLQNQYNQAIEFYSEVLKIRTDLGDTEGRLVALSDLARVGNLQDHSHNATPPYSEGPSMPFSSLILNPPTNVTPPHSNALGILAYSPTFKIPTRPGERQDRLDTLWGLAQVHRPRDWLQGSTPLYFERLENHSNSDDKENRDDTLYDLPQVRLPQNQDKEEVSLYPKAFDIHTNPGDRDSRGNALWGLAELRRREGKYNQAIPLYAKALEIRTGLGDRKGRADVLWGLAGVRRCQHQYNEAIPLYSEALEIRTDLGDRKGKADILWDLAQIHWLRHQYRQAIPLYSEVLEIHTDLGGRKGRADVLWELAQVHRLQHEYNKAIILYFEVLEIRNELGDRRGRADALWGLADVHRRQGKYSESIPFYSEALQICTDIGDKKRGAAALLGLAEVHQLQFQYDESIQLYSQAGRERWDPFLRGKVLL